MRLKSLSYKENLWELEKLSFGLNTLIVGKNATGKSRIVNVIHNLTRVILGTTILDGEWRASFLDGNNEEFELLIACVGGRITNEQIWLNGESKLNRTSATVRIYSESKKGWEEISPPQDRLVLHVRRDRNEFPFLENLFSWASNVSGFKFANTSPLQVDIPASTFKLVSLNEVPSALEQLSKPQLQNVLQQLEYMGYSLEDASTGWSEQLPPTLKIVFLKERGIAKPLAQFEISQGMFRAFSILTVMELIKAQGGDKTVLVDDFCEGLDFDRSKKLADLIFTKNNKSNMQFIATSNDSFLANAIPLNDLTVCYRKESKVRCLNYLNSKEKFDAWRQLGLNNFDLFSSDYLLNE